MALYTEKFTAGEKNLTNPETVSQTVTCGEGCIFPSQLRQLKFLQETGFLFYCTFEDILGRMLTEFSTARALVGATAAFPL